MEDTSEHSNAHRMQSTGLISSKKPSWTRVAIKAIFPPTKAAFTRSLRNNDEFTSESESASIAHRKIADCRYFAASTAADVMYEILPSLSDPSEKVRANDWSQSNRPSLVAKPTMMGQHLDSESVKTSLEKNLVMRNSNSASWPSRATCHK